MKGKRPPEDGARYLHRRPELGYTHLPSLAMRGEPEAIDVLTQRRFSREARWAWDEEHRQERLEKLRVERQKLVALRDEIDKRLVALDEQLGIKRVA